MTTDSQTLVIIPARMASTRLPGKPLADIGGVPMIVQVWRRAMEADVGPVVVAAAEAEIVDAVTQAGGRAVLTRPDHPSGSDRIFEAWGLIDPERRAKAILNVQGDLPTIDPKTIRATLAALTGADIATAVAPTHAGEDENPNVVKAVIAWDTSGTAGRALYFTRAMAPTGPGPRFHHIGLYAYQPQALTRFIALPPSALELTERLEQLRALEAGMVIRAALVDAVPLGVDTPQDLDRARAILLKRPH